jgi:hypothetical protein
MVSKISLSGGQGFVHYQCKKGNCKSVEGWKLCATLGVICLCHVATTVSTAGFWNGKVQNVVIYACCILCFFCFWLLLFIRFKIIFIYCTS